MTGEKPAVHHDAAKVPTLSRLGDHAKTISSSDEDIRGRVVRDRDGRDIGKIDGLLVDDVEGKVRFMEVASGGFLGLGEHKSFIPVDAITQIFPDAVHISHTREHVAGAPPYDPRLVAELYPYYGYPAVDGLFPPMRGYPYAGHPHQEKDATGG